MTLTVVIGSSGSGKTTFLNDTTKSHKCTYLRQCHNLRPYITVTNIPNFDPTRLPYWNIYVTEGTARTIKVGGTMAGEFTAGLSGGQRKLLLFELICQRTANQSDLLLVFDEPFAGVTDDFIPFIVHRLNELRQKHNILLVTNDRVETLKSMADNTIVVSAMDRSHVQINDLNKVHREKAILALSVGNQYVYNGASWSDLKFFWDVEVSNSGALWGVSAFTVLYFGLFMATFWDSGSDAGAMIIIAASMIAFYCVYPYLLALVDWRICVSEEAEALLHSSKNMSTALKCLLSLALIVIVSLAEWGAINAVVTGFEDVSFWIAILMDSVSLTISFIILGLYTHLPFVSVELLGNMPFLFMIFFSTTFSPGSGVVLFKELRYLFSRFYFWCMIPGVQEEMEGCPEDSLVNMLYMVLSAMLGLFLFLICEVVQAAVRMYHTKRTTKKESKLRDSEFQDLQMKLYGEASFTHHDSSMDSSRSSERSSVEYSISVELAGVY